jgi:hypothetical protein
LASKDFILAGRERDTLEVSFRLRWTECFAPSRYWGGKIDGNSGKA